MDGWRKRSEQLCRVALAAPILWLVVCAFTVEVEYFDGFDTICNTLYFTGESQHYLWNRNPAISLLMAPARWVGRALALSPRDVRAYHLEMCLFHIGLLVLCFGVLRKRASSAALATVAFAMGLLVFMFFSYAPFLSHDLLPGGILLGMLILAERFAEEPKPGRWLGLVLLGGAAALFKPTYGVLWLVVLLSRALPAACPKSFRLAPTPVRAWLLLGGGAGCSAALYWLVMGWALKGTTPGVAFLLRPWEQLATLGAAHAAMTAQPWWFYLRNLPFYGLGTVLLVLPGIYLSLKNGDRLGQSAALCWVFGFVAISLLPFKETRYIAFLMPLSAVVVLPALEWSWQRRLGRCLTLVVLAFDLTVAGREAARVRYPFYQHSQMEAFLGMLEEDDPQLVVFGDMLSFAPPLRSPLAGDPYHRLFHFDIYHLAILSLGRTQANRGHSADAMAVGLGRSDKTAVILPTVRLRNAAGWRSGQVPGWDKFMMLGCVEVELPMTLVADRVELADGGKCALAVAGPDGARQVTIQGKVLPQLLSGYVCPALVHTKTQATHRLVHQGHGTFLVSGLTKLPDQAQPGEWAFRGYRRKVVYMADPEGNGLKLVSPGIP